MPVRSRGPAVARPPAPAVLAWSLLRRLPAPVSYRLVHSAPAALVRLAAAVGGRRAARVPGGYRVAGLGVSMDNPVGVAAGLDKGGGLAWLAWSLGAGFHVVGSVTPEAHPGVEPKIVARHGEATLNRLGLPSEGARRVAERLARWRPPGMPVAASVAAFEPAGYAAAARAVAPVADWVEVNVSCPNTREHSTFEDPGQALRACLEARRASVGLPVLVKIPPKPRLAGEYVEAARRCGAAGLVAVNTLKVRIGDVEAGLGGDPLYPLALKTLRRVVDAAWEGAVIVAVGGITRPERAVRALEEGASLVEVLSALLLHGPARFAEIAEAAARWASRR